MLRDLVKPTPLVLDSIGNLWRQHPRYRDCGFHYLVPDEFGPAEIVYDLCGKPNPNDGTLTNGATLSTFQGETVIDVSGSGPRVEISYTIPSTTYTLVMWVYLDGTGSQYEPIFSEADSAPGLFIKDNVLLYWGGGPEYGANTTMTSNEWHLVGMTSTAGTGVFDLDGTNDGGSASTAAFTLQRIGYESFGDNFSGYVREARVYERALSDEDWHSLFFDPYLEFRWAYEQMHLPFFTLKSSGAPPSGGTPMHYYRRRWAA